MKRLTSLRIIVATLLLPALCACQTVRMPKIDLMKSPEFENDAANIGNDYPDLAEAPERPTDMRSDAQWDADAKALIAMQDGAFEAIPEDALSQAEIDARFEELKARAQAYKADDPPGGID